ncbi:MAG: Crp/Fnr family transcriptional regulator [Candidatus Neomarinimicrobiota bacterium]
MAEKTKLWYLHGLNILKGMEEKSLKLLSSESHMRQTPKKEIIYFPEEASDTIYFLKEGKIKISRISEDGRTTTLDLLGPGEIFGESSLLGQEVHENIAEVVEDAIICSIGKDRLQEFMNASPQLNLSITKFMGWKIRKIEAHVEDLVFKNAQERIIAFLRRYGNTFGKELVDGIIVRPFLTHQEIADLTATARQTVNMVLNDLVGQDKIKYSRRYFKILDKNWVNK